MCDLFSYFTAVGFSLKSGMNNNSIKAPHWDDLADFLLLDERRGVFLFRKSGYVLNVKQMNDGCNYAIS